MPLASVRRARATRSVGPLLGLPAVVAAVLVLSTGSTLVRKIGGPGVTVACYRSLMASVLWMVVLRVRGHWPTWPTIRRLAPVGALFGVNLAFFFAGVTRTSIANAEFIGILTPLIVMPAGALLFHERVPWRALPWAAGALVGVALVLFNAPSRGNASWAGNGLIVCAVATWAAYLLASRRVRPHVRVDEFMAVTALVAGVVLLPIVVAQGRLDGIPARGWPWLLVMTLVNGLVAHALLVGAQQRVPVGTISTMQVAQPALAALWAYLVLDETLRGPQFVGMAVVIVSLLLYTRSAQQTDTPGRRSRQTSRGNEVPSVPLPGEHLG